MVFRQEVFFEHENKETDDDQDYDLTASTSIQIRRGTRNRIYVLEY